MKRQYSIFLVIVILIIISIIFIVINKNMKNGNNNEIVSDVNEDKISEETNNVEKLNTIEEVNTIVEISTEELENMKKNINATGNTDIYQVEEEKDGRKILQIKRQVQFYVDLAGIIKKSKPEEKELESLIKEAPTDNGVWISSQSRNIFLNLLNKNGIDNFEIADSGYLKKSGGSKNNIANQLEKMINSNKLYILNITGVAYQRDYISGEIIEYPFEDMDPEQIIEPYRDGNKITLEINTNRKNKLTNKEILEAIVQY